MKVQRRGQNHGILKIQQHFGKQYVVRKSSMSKMQNGLTMQKRKYHLKNRIQNYVTRKLKSMADWKEAWPDKIQGFWLKSYTAVHEVLATVLNECAEVGDVTKWLVEGRTILVVKDSKKGAEVGNYQIPEKEKK